MNETISKNPLYNEIMKNRCLTCYKEEKRLVPLTEKRLLKTFVPEITLTHEDRVCESCDSMLKAIMTFRNTVLTAQLLLKTAYEQQSQDIEEKISITKISKEDVSHCSTLSFEYFPQTIKHDTDIKEESIDTEPATDNLEDSLHGDPIPEDFIIHEEVDIKTESTDTDQCSVDSDEMLSANLTSADEDHEISINGMWFNSEVTEGNKVASNSTKVNSDKNSPLLTTFLKNVPRKENKIRLSEENTISDDPAIKNAEKKSHDDPFKDGTIVMRRDDQAFIVKVLSEAEMQADREYKRTQRHYVESKLRCEMCILMYKSHNHYEKHMKTHDLSAGRFPCTICQQRFPNIADMETHRKTHYIKYVCIKCNNYGCTSLELAQLHFDRQHYVVKRTCNKCGAVFNLYTELLKHDMRVHSTQSKCTECGVVIRGKYNMKAHMARHKGNKPTKIVECNVCKKKMDVNKLRGHMKTVHNPDGEAYCIPCDQTFKGEHLYRIHLKQSQKHNSVESFKAQCEVCGRWLGSRKSLEHHMEAVHNDTAKYPCEKCDEKFKTLKSLRSHMRKKHENVARIRDKICEQCGKGFFLKKTLEEHMNTHTGARPHSCADCGVSFGFKAALFTHRRLKHKVKRKKDI